MNFFKEMKDFFAVDDRLSAERKKCCELKNEYNTRLVKLQRVSSIIDGDVGHPTNEQEETWMYLKKNCFVDDISKLLSGEK